MTMFMEEKIITIAKLEEDRNKLEEDLALLGEMKGQVEE